MSGFSDTGWTGVKGYLGLIREHGQSVKKKREENHRLYSPGDRSREMEESTTSDTGNKRRKEKKEKTAGICWKIV